MIEFEAKSIAQKFPAARDRLQVRPCLGPYLRPLLGPI
jgi:hypothetical protein